MPRSIAEVTQSACGKLLALHAFKFGELYGLLQRLGFSRIDVYADLALVATEGKPDWETVKDSKFFTYVARR